MFPKLYKQNNGKLYGWEIVLEEISENEIYINTFFGFVGGAIQKRQKKLVAGKANRDLREQAILEATSKWKDKKEKEVYSEDPGATKVVEEVRPMLAQTFLPDKFSPQRVFVQRKYDGIRCLAHWDADKGEMVLESRKGGVFPFFEEIKRELYEQFGPIVGRYWDGELYTDQLPFENLSGLIRKKTLTEQDKWEIKKIQFHIYDWYDVNCGEWHYEKRKEVLEGGWQQGNGQLVLVETEEIISLVEINEKHAKYVEEGFEGIILRWPESVYEVGKRSKGLQKYKKFMEEEFRIVGFREGEASETGCVLWECSNSDGKRFWVHPRGSHAVRKEYFLKGEEFIGRYLTVMFQEYSKEGIPRFPVGKGIRED